MIPLDHPLILVLTGAAGSTILGILAYQRGAKADKAVEHSQVIQGMDTLNQNLQEDNKLLRVEVQSLRADVKECGVKLEIVIAETSRLLAEVRSLTERRN